MSPEGAGRARPRFGSGLPGRGSGRGTRRGGPRYEKLLPTGAIPIPDLSTRRLQPELMDDPGLDPSLHRQALRALRRVNRISGTAGRIWRTVGRLARQGAGPIRILDVGCGGADTLVAIGRRAARSGVPVELHGCDRSATALDHARTRADAAGIVLQLHRADVLEDPLPAGFDLVTSTLFLHHLEGSEVVDLLARLRPVARGGLIQDLIRSRLGYLLAWTGLRLLSNSPVAHVDGPRSVEAGFTLEEAARMASDAGLPEPRLDRAWPERVVLRWGAA